MQVGKVSPKQTIQQSRLVKMGDDKTAISLQIISMIATVSKIWLDINFFIQPNH